MRAIAFFILLAVLGIWSVACLAFDNSITLYKNLAAKSVLGMPTQLYIEGKSPIPIKCDYLDPPKIIQTYLRGEGIRVPFVMATGYYYNAISANITNIITCTANQSITKLSAMTTGNTVTTANTKTGANEVVPGKAFTLIKGDSLTIVMGKAGKPSPERPTRESHEAYLSSISNQAFKEGLLGMNDIRYFCNEQAVQTMRSFFVWLSTEKDKSPRDFNGEEFDKRWNQINKLLDGNTECKNPGNMAL